MKPIRNIWKKAQKAAATLLILTSLCQMTPVYADNEEQGSSGDEVFHVEVVNNVSVDDINISLAEYELGLDGLERPFTQNQFVLPGQHVSKIVRITNVARSAWIRIKPDFAFADGMEGVDESMFVLADDNWIKRGEYWYYLKPVPTGESIDFIKEVIIPEDWTEEHSDKQFEITLRAEAVQSENFTPAFNTDDPWFGTLIEICVHNEYEEPHKIEIDDSFSVEFRNGADGLILLGDDWFKGFDKLMPGDTVSNFARISNLYSEPVDIYFYTENIVEGPDELLENLELTIRDGDRIIFQGKLDKTLKPIRLGTYYTGDITDLVWELHVPPELTNKFALTATKTKWVFEARLKNKGYQTGDTTEIMPYLIIGGTCTALLMASVVVLFVGRRKRHAKVSKA